MGSGEALASARARPGRLRTMSTSLQQLFTAGQRPIVAKRLAYYADAEFEGTFTVAL